MNILVLTTAYQSDLEKAIRETGHTAEFCNPNEFNMYISESTKGMDSVYKGEQRIFRSTYDCVISRVGNHRGYAARLIEHLQNKHDIRSNISREGTGKKITADSETRELCIKAVAAINGLNFAGVDVMKDTDGKPFVIEINSNPGTGIIGITGYNHFKDLVKYCERSYRDGSRIALQEKAQRMIVELYALATNLDSEFAQAFRELLSQ